jgi:predicted nucleic acid-binding protein
VDRVFLDANVLFSAAYRSDSGLLKLWKLKRTKLITSTYALEEARTNLPRRFQQRSAPAISKSPNASGALATSPC